MKTKEEIIQYRISKAFSTLKEAELMLSNNFTEASINRIYYSCFYAVTALLHKIDVKANTHKGVRQMFGLHFVHPSLISVDNAKFFTEIFDRRNLSDYSDFIVFDTKDVNVFLKKANEFIFELEQLINT